MVNYTVGDYMKIKEVIVVEGKNDTNVLKSYLECDTIETHGTHLGKETLAQIALMQKERGVIIFTDPDYPGEKIRTTINQCVPGCKNAYIEKNKAKTSKKVGVEHASKEDLLDALKNVYTYEEHPTMTLSWDEFLQLGLTGTNHSAALRNALATQLHLGRPNAKTLYKRLNMLHMNKEDVETLLGQ